MPVQRMLAKHIYVSATVRVSLPLEHFSQGTNTTGIGRAMFRNSPAWDGPFITNDNTGTSRCYCSVAPQSKDDPGPIVVTTSGISLFGNVQGVCDGSVPPDSAKWTTININAARTMIRGAYPTDPDPCIWYLRESAGLVQDFYHGTICGGVAFFTAAYDLNHVLNAGSYVMDAVPAGYDYPSASSTASMGIFPNHGRIFFVDSAAGALALDCLGPLTRANESDARYGGNATFSF